MINLKNIFHPNPCLLAVSKAEKDVLECFLDNKAEFDHWLILHPNTRARFRFYYPTAVDFFYDEFKLFTAYYKRNKTQALEFRELKMSKTNYSTIRTSNWQPFQEIILQFLNTLEENNKVVLFCKTKSLHEYAALCKEERTEKARQIG